MSIDDRFDALAETVGGFYRSWLVYLGLELGLFAALRDAGAAGLTAGQLAGRSGCAQDPVAAWIRAAHAAELIDIAADRASVDPDVATILLDDDRPEYLGGQFVWTVVASLDYEGLADFFRSGQPVAERPPRFHRAIEALTAQDIAVFFQEGLAQMPQLAADLALGGRVLDLACGGGRWLVAVARRFPNTTAVGIEFEPDSVARAKAHIADAGLSDRVRIEARDPADLPAGDVFDLVYCQDALHELADPPAALRSAWAALAPGGRLVVLDWCLPEAPEASRTLYGELLWSVNLDEIYQGTSLLTYDGFIRLFEAADLPAPSSIDLPSGATVFYLRREDA
jgi:SAM-dependent methyltransferase